MDDDITIFEIDTDAETIVIAGVSEQDVRDYILQNKKAFSSLDNKDYEVESSPYDFELEVTFINMNIEMLHTADTVKLFRDNHFMNNKCIPYTYEVDTLLVERNIEKKDTIMIYDI